MTDTPNPALLQVFGTEAFWHGNLEKTASPLAQAALRVGAPAAFMGLMAYQQHREAKQLLEAQILTEMFRQAEAGRMAPVHAGFRGQGPMLSDMGNAAANLRQMAAYEAMMRLKYSSAHAFQAMREELEGIEKEALGAPAWMAGAARRVAGIFQRGATRGGAAGATKALPVPPLRPGQSTSGLGLFDPRMPTARPGGALTAPTHAPARATAPPVPGAARTPGLTPPPRRGPLPPMPKPPGAPVQTATAPPAAIVAAPDARAAGAAKGRSLGRSLRNKALLYGGGTAALGGAGYVGYKGLQTAKDYMMQPSYMSTSWGPPGMMPNSGVNQYGYQDVYY